MQITKDILVPAKDISFLTNYEARLMLNLASSTDENLDDMIEMLIEWTSDEIAGTCMRDFAKETLIETFREINTNTKQLYLSHFPIVSVASVVSGGAALVENTDFEVDYENGGKITRLGSVWLNPTVVNYVGGYDLPAETPPALKKAAILLAREGYYAAIRGDATIKSVSHKESRVMYFDPNAALKALSGGGSGGSPAMRAVADILSGYTRLEV